MEKLFQHQTQALGQALRGPAFALFMDTGTGKTRVAIEAIATRKMNTLIVCPLSVISAVWLEEIRKWHPELEAINLWNFLQKKKPAPISKYAVYLINFESAAKVPAEILQTIQFIIVDESSRMKNPKAKITRFLNTLADKIPNRLIMSGCPAPNGLIEYFPQIWFIDRNILGTHYTHKFMQDFYRFRATHFFNANKYGAYYLPIPRKGTSQIIANMLRPISFQVKKADCLDLPPQVSEDRHCVMTPEQAKTYNHMLADNIAEFQGRMVLGANELAKIMKLRQITSGFFHDENGTPYRISDAKIRLLGEVLEEIGNQQVIIWCQFHEEIRWIFEAFESCVALYGDMTPGAREESLRKFLTGHARYLVAHPASGGFGLNLTNCHYAIYFSSSYSYEQQQQSMDRIYRAGQTKKVTYIHLLVPNTIDVVIRRALGMKRDLSDALLGMIKSKGEADALPTKS